MTIAHAAGSTTVSVDQQENGGRWNDLGTYLFEAGKQYAVTLHAPDPWPTSYCADAIRFVRTGS